MTDVNELATDELLELDALRDVLPTLVDRDGCCYGDSEECHARYMRGLQRVERLIGTDATLRPALVDANRVDARALAVEEPTDGRGDAPVRLQPIGVVLTTEAGAYTVTVDLTGVAEDIGDVLHDLERHVTERGTGPATVRFRGSVL